VFFFSAQGRAQEQLPNTTIGCAPRVPNNKKRDRHVAASGRVSIFATNTGSLSKTSRKVSRFAQCYTATLPTDGVIGGPSLWIAEDFGCCASG
jgi:hypothetical protein